MSTKTNTRKILVPLATLLVAAAVAVGSGATFTSSSDSAITATAGDLIHVNSEDGATLHVTNLKPGATETGSLTITNSGSLNSDSRARRDAGHRPGEHLPGWCGHAHHRQRRRCDRARLVLADQLLGTTDATYDLGDLTGGSAEEITVNFTVSMAAGATDLNQGKSASVDLEFVTTQTDATDDESAASFS